MIRDLLTPEAQAGAYEWAAVLLAHVAIGVCLRLVLRRVWVIAVGYAAFELLQTALSGLWLPWDSLLDWVAVMLGAVAQGPLAVAAIAAVTLAGIRVRRDKR